MNSNTLGIDIGGANLKAAHRDGTARTVPFALWKHPERLQNALKSLGSGMPKFDCVALTMTGELCDCYASKSEGVRAILEAAQRAYEPSRIRVWSLHSRFLDVPSVKEQPLSVAAANWLAQAHFVARQFAEENVLLIDIGSTTTDVVYLGHGEPLPRGRSDAARLQSGELIYTGVRRTPICAVLGMEVAAEFFATMHDAYLCLGMARADATDCDTADGRPATRAFAHARLARMRCADADQFSREEARTLAKRAIRTQWAGIARAIEIVLANRPKLDRVVVSGSGDVVGRFLCRFHRSSFNAPVTLLASLIGPRASEAACAYAVAMLASEE
jgi:(4-(4-[2-(gamma-L-glutamylamino)ethyl]phenoxymethyl)furan-2-yl)methanamine synthase